MTPEQIIVALSIQLAETTAERDGARAEVAGLRQQLASTIRASEDGETLDD